MSTQGDVHHPPCARSSEIQPEEVMELDSPTDPVLDNSSAGKMVPNNGEQEPLTHNAGDSEVEGVLPLGDPQPVATKITKIFTSSKSFFITNPSLLIL